MASNGGEGEIPPEFSKRGFLVAIGTVVVRTVVLLISMVAIVVMSMACMAYSEDSSW